MISKRFNQTLLLSLLATSISGCSWFSIDSVTEDNTQEYRRAETMPPLDVPPDLSTSRINDRIAGDQANSATYSEYEEAETNPLATLYGVDTVTKPSLSGEGETRHLIVPGDYSVVWERIDEFWVQAGISIKRQNQSIGLMDTETGSDNYAYRMRLERGDTSRSQLVYITGRDSETVNKQKDEAMLRELADFLGVLHQDDQTVLAAQKAATAGPAAVSSKLMNDQNGDQFLMVDAGFSDVWSRVGRILDSKGFTVEDRDRSHGSYFVRFIDPSKEAQPAEKGLWDKMAFWRDDVDSVPEEFLYLKLVADDVKTRLLVLDVDQKRMSSTTSETLLKFFKEQLAL